MVLQPGWFHHCLSNTEQTIETEDSTETSVVLLGLWTTSESFAKTELNLADIFTKALQGKSFRSQWDSFLHDCREIYVHGKIDMIEINHDPKVACNHGGDG